MAAVAEPQKSSQGARTGINRFSVVSQDSRRQIGMVVALTTVIPLLAFTYALATLSHATVRSSLLALFVVLAAFVSAFLGFLVISAYSVNIRRLRHNLEDVIAGRFEGEVHLQEGMADFPAIEGALQSVVKELQRKVERVEGEMSRVEILLSRRLTDATEGAGVARPWSYFQGETGAPGLVKRCLGPEALAGVLTDVLDLVESAGVAYEVDGELALGIAASSWYRTLCTNGPSLFLPPTTSPPQGDPSTSRLHDLAARCMQTDSPAFGAIDIGGNAYFVPLHARGQVAGALGFAFGQAPRDAARRDAIAQEYGLTAASLLPSGNRTDAPDELPAFVITLAKHRLVSLARLIGESMERRLAEEELRVHHNTLEETVRARTAEQEATNAQLEAEIKERLRAEELKDEFVSTVSHELRTPLAITKEGIALLLDGIPGDVNDKQRKVLTSARGNIDRLARIINDLLDISKIEAGKMQMNKASVDMAALVEGVVRNFEVLARQKGLRLDLDQKLTNQHVLADPDRIVQVLTNLISNALKFTAQGGVRVSTLARGEQVACIVEDSGVGLTKEEVTHVFDKFTQFGRTHGAGEKGTGLGLSIAKQIVELHRGRIWAESTTGQGSRFSFLLPAFSEDELVRESIEQAILEARAAKDGFLLLLFDLDPRLAAHDNTRRKRYTQGFDQLRATESLVRTSDRMVTRGGNQIVLVAKIAPSQLATLYRRWHAQMTACFTAIDPTLDVNLAWGYADYPADGTTADELLERADQTLSPHASAPKASAGGV